MPSDSRSRTTQSRGASGGARASGFDVAEYAGGDAAF